MRTVVTYLLAFSIMGGAVHLDELGKLPMLYNHYLEHKKLHPGDSAFDFMYRHYIVYQKAESAKDKRSDSKLPFKSDHAFHAHYTAYISEHIITETASIPVKVFFIPYAVSKALAYPFDVWQPPRP